jgi:hypothetical protein
MEGTNQFVSWRHVMEFISSNFGPVDAAAADPNVSFADYLGELNTTIDNVLNNGFLVVSQDDYDNITNSAGLLTNPNLSDNETVQLEGNIYIRLLKIIFDGYGFQPPESALEATENPEQILNIYYRVFELVFGYFFICAGLVLIFLGVLSWLSHSKGLHESRSHLGGIISKFVIGLGLVLLSTMDLTPSADALGGSAWTLPLLFFLLAIALTLNHIPWSNFRRSRGGLPLNNQTNNRHRQNRLPWGGFMRKQLSRKGSLN